MKAVMNFIGKALKTLLKPRRWEDMSEQERIALMESNRKGLMKNPKLRKAKFKDPRVLAKEAGIDTPFKWDPERLKTNRGRAGWGAVANLDIESGYSENARRASSERNKKK